MPCLSLFACSTLTQTSPDRHPSPQVVALEFVISVDELIFEALAPQRVRRLFATARDLSVPHSTSWRGLDRRSTFSFFAVVAVLAGFVAMQLMPQLTVLVGARDALCAGDLEFVFTRDGVGTFAWAYPDTVDRTHARALTLD